MTKILADMHHGDLYESLRILFEDRLGWELYRPIGTEWYYDGYWKVYDHPNTADQYLGISSLVPLSVNNIPVTQEHGNSAWINRIQLENRNGIYIIRDCNHGGRNHKAITLAAAKDFGFDIVLSSMPVHFSLYENFRQQFCPNAKHIFQVGNVNWNVPPGAKNLLNSTTLDPGGVHSVRYHQEFSLTEFSFKPCPNPRSLTNLMHIQAGHYAREFYDLKKLLRGWVVKDYGATNVDGPVDNISEVIQNSGFIWHCKRGGDGYGYNVHNAFACGRPMVTACSQYLGLMAEPLFMPGVTVIDLEKHGVAGVATKLKEAADDYDNWSRRTYAQFCAVVDFDKEFEQIKHFLGNLQ